MIESFRNDLFPGYKSSAGMPPELLAQFPIAEAAIEALGIVLWPMVEFEADDAIAAAAVRFARGPGASSGSSICTPDKDMAQLVVDDRIVLWDRRRDLTYDDAGVRAKWGVPPDVDPRLPRRSSATRPTAIPGIPGWGAKATAAVLARYGHSRTSRSRRRRGRCRASAASRAMSLAAALRDQWDEALLYRDLARLRTAEDGVQIRQQTSTSCAGTARRATRGRRSATSGASTGFDRGPIAGARTA